MNFVRACVIGDLQASLPQEKLIIKVPFPLETKVSQCVI